jgi:hypothetical protein
VLALFLFLGFLGGMIIALVLIFCGIVLGALRGRHSRSLRLQAVALVAAAAAIGMYAWGLGSVGSAVLQAEDGGTDSSPLIPCRGEADAETVARVTGYQVGFMPPRFECSLSGGGSYTTSSVPTYLNPATVALSLMAFAFGVLSLTVRQRQSSR